MPNSSNGIQSHCYLLIRFSVFQWHLVGRYKHSCFKSPAQKILVASIRRQRVVQIICVMMLCSASFRFSRCVVFKWRCYEHQYHEISQVSFQIISVLLHISCNNIKLEMWKLVAGGSTGQTHVSMVSMCSMCVRKKNICLAQVLKKKTILEGQTAHPSNVCLLLNTLQATNICRKLRLVKKKLNKTDCYTPLLVTQKNSTYVMPQVYFYIVYFYGKRSSLEA